jgi:hypothetical protein
LFCGLFQRRDAALGYDQRMKAGIKLSISVENPFLKTVILDLFPPREACRLPPVTRPASS